MAETQSCCACGVIIAILLCAFIAFSCKAIADILYNSCDTEVTKWVKKIQAVIVACKKLVAKSDCCGMPSTCKECCNPSTAVAIASCFEKIKKKIDDSCQFNRNPDESSQKCCCKPTLCQKNLKEPSKKNKNPYQENLDLGHKHFKPCQESFQPCQDNFKPCRDNFKPCRDNFKPCQNNFKPYQDNIKPCQDNFKPCQYNFKPRQDNFKPRQDNFKPCQDNYHAYKKSLSTCPKHFEKRLTDSCRVKNSKTYETALALKTDRFQLASALPGYCEPASKQNVSKQKEEEEQDEVEEVGPGMPCETSVIICKPRCKKRKVKKKKKVVIKKCPNCWDGYAF